MREKNERKTECLVCKKEFKQRFGREKFCSRACFHNSTKAKRIKTNCKHCGKDLQLKESIFRGHGEHSCSRECRRLAMIKHKMVTRKCAWCGEDYEIYSSKKTTHCSTDCSNKTNALRRKEKLMNEHL